MMRPRRDPKIRVWLIDREDPIDIQTNRLDWVAITTDVNAPKPFDMMAQVAHKALLNRNYDVPASYFLFLDKCLDGNPEEVTGGDPESMDPTQKDPLD
jgi:hypothetical protein